MNWDWFYAMYSMAAIFMIINFFWRIVLVPIAAFSLLFKDSVATVLLFLSNAIPYYFMASYAALVGIGIGEGDKSLPVLIFGGIFLVMSSLLGIASLQRQAEQERDYASYKYVGYKTYLVLIALIYYIYAIFDTRVALNKSTIWLNDLIQWVLDIPIVGLIIAIMAVLYVLYVLYSVAMMVIGIVMNVVERNISN